MNREILNLLQLRGRTTMAEIASRLRRPDSSILERKRRMEAKGMIKGNFACVDKRALGCLSTAFVFLHRSTR